MTTTTTKIPPFMEVKDGEMRLSFHSGHVRAWNSTRRFPVLLSGSQSGKALDIETPIPTTEGFKPMSQIQIGDMVFDESGSPCRVLYTSPIVHRQCSRVVFDEGSEIITDEDHLWETQTLKQRKNQARSSVLSGNFSSVVTSREIRATLIDHRGASNHAVQMPMAVQYPERELTVPPYTLGAWLGDGSSRAARIYSADTEVLDEIRAEGVLVGAGRSMNEGNQALAYQIGRNTKGGNDRGNPALDGLRELGVVQNKHIPEEYFIASINQRLALLKGLMDTDGYCGKKGDCEFSSKTENLAVGVRELLASFGIKSHLRERRARLYGKDCGVAYRVIFTTHIPVFSLPRKAVRQIGGFRPDRGRRYIRKVVPTLVRPVKCIQVDSPNSLYLAGRDYIPTHNTVFGPHWLHREIEQEGPGDYLAVTATFTLLRQKMLRELKLLFETHLKWGIYKAGDKLFESYEQEHGAPAYRIIIGSATNPESLESATAKGAWLDEVGQHQFNREAWDAIQRRLAIHQGRCLMTTTPYEWGWFKAEIYDRWMDGDSDIDIIQVASIENPTFSRAEYERQQRIMPSWKFRMFFQGSFEKPAGLIYDSFDENICCIPRFSLPQAWPRYVGHDFGPNNTAAVWYAQDPGTGFLYVYRDYLAGGLSAFDHAQKFKELSQGEIIVKRVGGAHAEDGWRESFTAAGWPISEPREHGVEVGINTVYGWYKQNRLFVFKDVTRYLDELNTYSRKLDENYEPTGVIDNKSRYHEMDCARYLLSDFGPERVLGQGNMKVRVRWKEALALGRPSN